MKNLSVQDLAERLEHEGDSLMLVDVRGDENFEKEHIPSAKSIPESAFSERIDGLVNKDSEIVVYCGSEQCTMSKKAGEHLEEIGYKNVARFSPGLKGWKEAGHSTVTG
jgi:rhodanese-related sulfurtransferase